MRVLVVEDNDLLFEEFMRIFGNFDLEGAEFVRCPTIEAFVVDRKGCGPGVENWDIILMDYNLNPFFTLPATDDSPEAVFRNGSDLIRLRRHFEAAAEDVPPAIIVGTASNSVGNKLMADAGADVTFMKSSIPAIAELLVKHNKKDQ